VSSVVEALAREVGAVGKALHKLTPAQWAAPTRCAPMDVKALVAHTWRGCQRINEMLAVEPSDEQPEKDAVTYFQYDAVAEAPSILTRAQEVSASFATPAELVAAWDREWIRALQGARGALGADPVLPTIFGLMRLSEYLRTRIVEVTVHHLDLDDALGHTPHPDAGALEAVGDVLRGLLGTDLRPVGMNDLRFALTGTGRASLTDDERAYLGPLADKFPLFS
jgi:uncharacterized protein (TIGR03083 family)